MFCFNPSPWPPVLCECGNLLLRLVPNTGRPICISIGIWWGDIGFSVLIILTDLWKLVAAIRGPPLHHYYLCWQLVCLPSLHSLSLLVLRRGFRRTPTNHTMRLTWTLRHCDLLRFLSLLPSLCLRGLFPLSDSWHSSHSPSHQPSTSRYSASYSYPLVEYEPHWVFCRWLAGDNQKIPIPYFYLVNFTFNF